ncbi:MAG: FadR family transcriptional regulator [Alphaproteobacteria bacterium]|nr:FadR family transcriptional regulator [Alphaproteobacteria bacterium]
MSGNRIYPRRSLHGQIVHDIGRRIATGEIKPGQSLPSEESLCLEMDVSRTALREAMKVLGAKGMIESRPRRGITVLERENWNALDPDVLSWAHGGSPDADYMHKLVEVRRIVEPAAAELAAKRATDGELAAIQKAFDDMARQVDDIDAFIAADLESHAAIISASHNEFLRPVANVICAAMLSSLRITNPTVDRNRYSLELHDAINAAIQNRHPDAAREAMLAHQAHMSELIRQVYGEMGE